MPNYSQYQGPSTEWEHYMLNNPVKSTGLSPSETPVQLREKTNASRLQASQDELKSSGLLDKIVWTDYSVPTRDQQAVPLRVYRAKDVPSSSKLPVYLFFHGGGFLFGTLESEDANCARVVAALPGIMVVNVCYRHTPEYTHPTQIHDAWDSFDWLTSNIDLIGGDATSVIVGGISAGAGLAAGIVLREVERTKAEQMTSKLTILGQLLCIPWIIHLDAHPHASEPFSSVQQNTNAPVLPLSQVNMFTELLNVKNPNDPYFNVALTAEEKLSGMPRTSFLVAGQDVLRDDALIYADKLKRIGIPVEIHVFTGLPHGFRRFANLESSQRWDSLIIQSLQWFMATN